MGPSVSPGKYFNTDSRENVGFDCVCVYEVTCSEASEKNRTVSEHARQYVVRQYDHQVLYLLSSLILSPEKAVSTNRF